MNKDGFMTTGLFTYGSLMFPEVWQKVVNRPCGQVRGEVRGYARYLVRGMSYPGMIARADHLVEGVLYFDIGPEELALLDAFEGEAYERRPVTVRLDDGRHIEAQAYLFREPAQLSEQSWDPRQFAMQRFLQTHF